MRRSMGLDFLKCCTTHQRITGQNKVEGGLNQNEMGKMVWTKTKVTQACERVAFGIDLGVLGLGLFLEQSLAMPCFHYGKKCEREAR